MSSQRTGILSLIRLNSEQDQDVILESVLNSWWLILLKVCLETLFLQINTIFYILSVLTLLYNNFCLSILWFLLRWEYDEFSPKPWFKRVSRFQVLKYPSLSLAVHYICLFVTFDPNKLMFVWQTIYVRCVNQFVNVRHNQSFYRPV